MVLYTLPYINENTRFFFQEGSHYLDKAGLELTAILLPLPPDRWNYSHIPPFLDS